MAPTAFDALMNIASSSNIQNSVGGPHDALLADGRLNPAAIPDAATLASIDAAQRSGVLTTIGVAAIILTVFLLYGLGVMYARIYQQRRAWHEILSTPYPAIRKDLNRVSTPLPTLSPVSLAQPAAGMPSYAGYAVARDDRIAMVYAGNESVISEASGNTPPGLSVLNARSETTLVDLSSGRTA
uniref:Expressed protein n=1 Tax=Schizophyllum commune (strain H4-8 / FGSC 9210) TaxID=578458 RepID=D8QAI5_SCHCM